MQDPKHPVWLILGFLVTGALGLGYCTIMYNNGADPLKDGGLIAIITGLSVAVGRFTGGK
jgi:hypothetical protein